VDEHSSKGDNIRGTSAAMWLKRDKIIEIKRFSSSKDFVSKRIIVYMYYFFNFEPVSQERFRFMGSDGGTR